MTTIAHLFGHKAQVRTYKQSSVFKSNRAIGVELEYENLAHHPEILAESNLWEIVEDGSLRMIADYTYSLELRYSTPLSGTDSERALEELRKYLKRDKNIVCSNRTGLHVHMDFRDLSCVDLKKFMLVYLIVEPILYRYCGKDRESNIFCLPLYSTPNIIAGMPLCGFNDNDIYRIIDRNHKYSGLNINSIKGKGSVEFRLTQQP